MKHLRSSRSQMKMNILSTVGVRPDSFSRSTEFTNESESEGVIVMRDDLMAV